MSRGVRVGRGHVGRGVSRRVGAGRKHGMGHRHGFLYLGQPRRVLKMLVWLRLSAECILHWSNEEAQALEDDTKLLDIVICHICCQVLTRCVHLCLYFGCNVHITPSSQCTIEDWLYASETCCPADFFVCALQFSCAHRCVCLSMLTM